MYCLPEDHPKQGLFYLHGQYFLTQRMHQVMLLKHLFHLPMLLTG